MIDRRNAPEVAKAQAGTVATLTVTVDEHIVPHNPRQPYRVWCSDETGRLCLTYFNGREDYLKKLLPPGERRVISGKVELYQGEVQMTHPDHVVPLEELDIDPAGRAGLWPDRRPDAAAACRRRSPPAVERAPELPEWQDAAYLKKQKWPGWKPALATAHAPADETDLSPMHPAARAARLRRAAGEPARDRAGAPSQPHPAPAARPRATSACGSARWRRCRSS